MTVDTEIPENMDNIVEQSRAIIEQGSKSFATAARLFNTQTREHAYMLYAWCRYCDDVIDGQELGFGQTKQSKQEHTTALDYLYTETQNATSGQVIADPIFVGLQRVVKDCEIPAIHPRELIDGFAMDVDERRYDTIDDVLTYCYHVAGVVGLMMAMIMGVRDKRILNRACDLGLAFQLTNICRDILEDASVGRIYLPQQWLDEANVPIDPSQFPQHTEQLYCVARRMLLEAERFYISSLKGLPHLSFRSAWAIGVAHYVYREIGQQILRAGPPALKQRSIISRNQKVFLAAKAGTLALATRLQPKTYHDGDRHGLWTRSWD